MTAPQHLDAPGPDPRDRRGPLMIIGGLAGVVIANAIMIGIALSHPSVPETHDHWAESLDWDRELERRAHSRALGWSLASLEREHDGVALEVHDAQGRPLAGLHGTLTLRRADRAGDDRTLTLVELGEGRYRSAETIPAAGLVELQVELGDAGGEQWAQQRWLELATFEEPQR